MNNNAILKDLRDQKYQLDRIIKELNYSEVLNIYINIYKYIYIYIGI